MTRKVWVTGTRSRRAPPDGYRCDATVYIGTGNNREAGRCQHRAIGTSKTGARYCNQHGRIQP